eukprot:COSAG03_NODE_5281_length_1288_cov_1.138772_1_plen_100_part_00
MCVCVCVCVCVCAAGAGLRVAAAKLGWQHANDCAVRRGTRAGAVMRETAEYRQSADFRHWLREEFRHDIEVLEYAKAVARWQSDSLAQPTAMRTMDSGQ